MRHIWSVLCRYAIEDKDSQNYSLIETLSSVSFKGHIPEERPVSLPFKHRIVTLWRHNNDLSGKEYPVRLRVFTPANVEVVSAEMIVDLKGHGTLKTNFNSDTFQYTSDGIYEYEISYRHDENWIVAAQVPLNVTHEQPEPDQQESEPTE